MFVKHNRDCICDTTARVENFNFGASTQQAVDTPEKNKGAQVKSQTKQDQDLAVDHDDDTNVVDRLRLDLGLLVIDQV